MFVLTADRKINVATDKELYLAVSIGVADRTITTRDWQQMVERADHALLDGKRRGRKSTQSASHQLLSEPVQ